jgi:hypothetical protein
VFTLSLLQAINDWQRNADPGKKSGLAADLRREADVLPPQFRTRGSHAFRKLDLYKDTVWKIADELELPETISSWSLSPEAASRFNGGVPLEGIQGVIFSIPPGVGTVILNLDMLYRTHEFRQAVKRHRAEITNYDEGIGHYENREVEVLIELKSIRLTDIHALGGRSGSPSEIFAQVNKRRQGDKLPPLSQEEFDKALATSAAKLGADWIEGGAKDRVLAKIAAIMPQLRAIKSLQDEQHSHGS